MSQSDPRTPAWDDALLKRPHEVQDKRRRVQQMFAAIAPSYDLNNRLHSFFQDQRWRKKAVKLAMLTATDVVVDVACGTGDLTRELHRFKQKMAWATRCPAKTVGVDFTYEMLPIARLKLSGHNDQASLQKELESEHAEYAKIEARSGKEIAEEVRKQLTQSCVRFINGDATSLPLPERFADVVSIAFGIRNVQGPMAALGEFHRVLRPGGRVIILEFSLPTNRILRAIYNFYFRKILPRTATLISRDKTGAYKYLPESVCTFITRETMMQMMREAGFERVEQFPMTFGVCLCYRGFKPAENSPQ